MPKFFVDATLTRSVDYTILIEADSREDAKAMTERYLSNNFNSISCGNTPSEEVKIYGASKVDSDSQYCDIKLDSNGEEI